MTSFHPKVNGMKLSKEAMVYATLEGMAKNLGPMGRLPRITEICEKLQISRSTLNRVLHRLQEDHILICEQGKGIFVSPLSMQRRIGILLSSEIYCDQRNFSQFWGLLHSAAIRFGQENGYELRSFFHCPSIDEPEKPSDALHEALQRRRLDGMVALGIWRPGQYRWLERWKKPIVSLMRGRGDVSVSPDMDAASAFSIQALCDAGCRSVAVVDVATSSTSPSDVAAQQRIASYRAAFQNCGLAWDDKWMWFLDRIPESDRHASREQYGSALAHLFVAGLLTGPDGHVPAGILITDDTVAHGFLIGMLRAGLSFDRAPKFAVLTNRGAGLLAPFFDTIIRVETDPEAIIQKLLDVMQALLLGLAPREKEIGVKPQLVLPSARS